MRQLYVTVYDSAKELTDEQAFYYASALLKELPDKEGIVRWNTGICACFNEKAKRTVIQIWKTNERK